TPERGRCGRTGGTGPPSRPPAASPTGRSAAGRRPCARGWPGRPGPSGGRAPRPRRSWARGDPRGSRSWWSCPPRSGRGGRSTGPAPPRTTGRAPLPRCRRSCGGRGPRRRTSADLTPQVRALPLLQWAMFSRRTGWARAPNRLSAAVEARRRSGAPLLDLTETNPTRAGLRAPADVLRALADPGALAYEPDPLGRLPAREAITADFRRRGADVAPDRLLLTASTSEAYAFAFKLLCDPGDTILVPRPSYPLFEYLAGLESVSVESYPLRYDGTWHIDLAELADALTERTRAIVAVSPNNPTGSFAKVAEVEALRSLAARHGSAILSDEVFADFPLRDDPARARTLFADGPALTLCLGGLSKSCGLPQLKLAWMALAGPAAAREEARARLEVVADTYLSVSTP